MKITTKGQVTIPKHLREEYGLLPHTEVEFRPAKDGVKIIQCRSQKGRGWALVEHMQGRSTKRMKTDELMKMTRGED